MPSRGCPLPPEGRRWGPAKSPYGGGSAGGPAVAWCSGSVVIVTGGTNTAASAAGRKARRRQRRAANRRHQQSREGRLDHRDRQRAYRERHSLRRVTDHTSPATYDSGSIGVAELSRSENGPESFRGEARYADCPEFEPICIICGRTRKEILTS